MTHYQYDSVGYHYPSTSNSDIAISWPRLGRFSGHSSRGLDLDGVADIQSNQQ